MTDSEQGLKAAGYVRVSSKEQVGGESLSTQRQSIKDYAKAQGWKLTDIYADEGISGGSVKERHALLRCLQDGMDGRFNVLIIHRLSRFGRNARELMNNQDELNKVGISLRSISEGIDFGTKYGKAMLGMFAVMAELERDVIRETMLENRIARAKRGIPTSGSLPFGRTFNKATGQWYLNEEAANALRWVAGEYLDSGVSLKELSDTLRTRYKINLSYSSLIDVLSQRCGDTWTVNFKGEEPIKYQIPRILDDDTIQRIRERLEYNRIECRKDVKGYTLTGFIRCEQCGKSLGGQTQMKKYGKKFQYYQHWDGKREKCHFNSVPLQLIENAIFRTIFENTVDAPAFERAIKDSLPDEDLILSLEKQVKAREKELKRTEKELDKLVNLALEGTLKKETIHEREKALYEVRGKASEELENTRARIASMPNLARVKQEAKQIRRQLLEHFSGEDRLQAMTFDEKKHLLHWLFEGKDGQGTQYGIYISKRGNKKYDYFLYGRITGLRTMKGDDINYQRWDEDEYKTCSGASGASYLIQKERT